MNQKGMRARIRTGMKYIAGALVLCLIMVCCQACGKDRQDQSARKQRPEKTETVSTETGADQTSRTKEEKEEVVGLENGKRLRMEQTTVFLAVGESQRIDVQGTDKERWTSGDSLIAKVDPAGNVTGVKPGNCTVTASVDGHSFHRRIKVSGFPEKSLSIRETEDARPLTLENVTGKAEFKSSNEKVARVIDNQIVPQNYGNCKITATAGGKTYTLPVIVTVTQATEFVNLLEQYHQYIRSHGSQFRNNYDSSLTTFDKARAKVEKGQIATITCVVPCRWALAQMDIRRADGKALLNATNGTFGHQYSGGVEENFMNIGSGPPIKCTVKEAVDKGLLRKGDVLAFQGHTHTFVYSGQGYYMYEGGAACVRNGCYMDGILMNYATNYYGRHRCKLNQILRWKK